jgi:hypothetical protein
MRPQNWIPRSQWDRGNFMTKIFNLIYIFSVVHCRSRITFHVGSRGLNETAEILWHCGNPYKNEYWFSFPLKGIRFWRFPDRFSRRIRSHMQNGFRPWTRALVGIVWWKKRGSKICPFNYEIIMKLWNYEKMSKLATFVSHTAGAIYPYY